MAPKQNFNVVLISFQVTNIQGVGPETAQYFFDGQPNVQKSTQYCSDSIDNLIIRNQKQWDAKNL